MVKISRVEVGWLGQCSKFGGASRELWHHAHGYGTDFGPCPRVEVRFFSRFELSWSAVPDKASVAAVVGASWDVDVCRVGVWRPI
jgi:hypothetical protein